MLACPSCGRCRKEEHDDKKSVGSYGDGPRGISGRAGRLARGPRRPLGQQRASYEFTYENGQMVCTKLGADEVYKCRVFGNTLTGTYEVGGVTETENAEIVVDGSGRPIEIR